MFFSGQNQTCSYLSTWRLKPWLHRSGSWVWAGTVGSHNQIPACWWSIPSRQVKCCKGHPPVTKTTKQCPRNGSVPQDWFDWSLRLSCFVRSALCVLEKGVRASWLRQCLLCQTHIWWGPGAAVSRRSSQVCRSQTSRAHSSWQCQKLLHISFAGIFPVTGKISVKYPFHFHDLLEAFPDGLITGKSALNCVFFTCALLTLGLIWFPCTAQEKTLLRVSQHLSVIKFLS